MRVRFFPLFVMCLVCAFSAHGQIVVESETEILLGENSSTVILNVNSPESISAVNVRVSFLSPSSEIKDPSEVNLALVKGRNRLEIPVSITDIVREKDFAFYRLRYEIGNRSGTIALSHIVGDIFDIEAFAFDLLQKGSIYRVRARAIQSITLKGVANVQVSGIDQQYQRNRPGKIQARR